MLWSGEWQAAGFPSQSEADLALCAMMTFWTNRDTAQMDRLFRSSGLMRGKWDEKHGEKTYGEITVEKALSGNGETYSPENYAQTKRDLHTFETSLGSKLTRDKAEIVINNAPPVPDLELARVIVTTLLPGREKPPMMIRRGEAGKLLLDWLGKNGGFVQGEDSGVHCQDGRQSYPLAFTEAEMV